MKKNYFSELDFILEQLILEYQNLNEGVKFYSGEAPISTKEEVIQKTIKKYDLKEWEINVLFHHLLIDKYIISIDPLYISLEGLVFINNGGYQQFKINNELENRRIQQIEADLKKYSLGLMIFTGILAFGTMISACYFALEILRYFRK